MTVPPDFGPAASPRQVSGRATVADESPPGRGEGERSTRSPSSIAPTTPKEDHLQPTAPAAEPCVLDVLLTAAVREAQSDGVSLEAFVSRTASTWLAVDRSTIDSDRIADAAVRVCEADRDGNLAMLLVAVRSLAEALHDSALLS